MREIASLAGALKARAKLEINARQPSVPSSLPPQLVIAWLSPWDVPSALSVSVRWNGASEAVFQLIAQSRDLARARADIAWRDVFRFSLKRVIVFGDELYPTHDDLARSLGVFDNGWIHGFGEGIGMYDEEPPEPSYSAVIEASHVKVEVSDTGNFISEVVYPRSTAPDLHAVAFRAFKNDAIYVFARRSVVVGYPGEFLPLTLTPAQVETFSVPELKRQLSGRGLETTGLKLACKKRLLKALRKQTKLLTTGGYGSSSDESESFFSFGGESESDDGGLPSD